MITAFIVGIVLGSAGAFLICLWLFSRKSTANLLPISESVLENVDLDDITNDAGSDTDLITLVEDFKREQKQQFESLQKLTDDLPQNSESLKQNYEIEYDEAKFL